MTRADPGQLTTNCFLRLARPEIGPCQRGGNPMRPSQAAGAEGAPSDGLAHTGRLGSGARLSTPSGHRSGCGNWSTGFSERTLSVRRPRVAAT